MTWPGAGSHSAPNGDTFMHRKPIEKMLYKSSYTFVCRKRKSTSNFSNRFSVKKSITIGCRDKFCVGASHFDGLKFI